MEDIDADQLVNVLCDSTSAEPVMKTEGGNAERDSPPLSALYKQNQEEEEETKANR